MLNGGPLPAEDLDYYNSFPYPYSTDSHKGMEYNQMEKENQIFQMFSPPWINILFKVSKKNTIQFEGFIISIN